MRGCAVGENGAKEIAAVTLAGPSALEPRPILCVCCRPIEPADGSVARLRPLSRGRMLGAADLLPRLEGR